MNFNRYDRFDVKQQNHESFNRQMYNEVLKDASNLSLKEQIKYEDELHYLVISSADRDLSMYPSSNRFSIELNEDFRNISSIEFIQAIIPDKNNITSEPYLLLKIDELERTMKSNNKHISDAFAILQPAKPTVSDNFIQFDKKIAENVILYYKTPKASLSKLTVTITDFQGIPFDFGGDNTLDKQHQVTFALKVVCQVKSRSDLGTRNVF